MSVTVNKFEGLPKFEVVWECSACDSKVKVQGEISLAYFGDLNTVHVRYAIPGGWRNCLDRVYCDKHAISTRKQVIIDDKIISSHDEAW